MSVRNDVFLPAEGKYFLRVLLKNVSENTILTLLNLIGFTRGKIEGRIQGGRRYRQVRDDFHKTRG